MYLLQAKNLVSARLRTARPIPHALAEFDIFVPDFKPKRGRHFCSDPRNLSEVALQNGLNVRTYGSETLEPGKRSCRCRARRQKPAVQLEIVFAGEHARTFCQRRETMFHRSSPKGKSRWHGSVCMMDATAEGIGVCLTPELTMFTRRARPSSAACSSCTQLV